MLLRCATGPLQMPEQIDWEGQKAQIDAAKAAGAATWARLLLVLLQPHTCMHAVPCSCSVQCPLHVLFMLSSRLPGRTSHNLRPGVKHVVIVSSMGGTDPSNFLNTIGEKLGLLTCCCVAACGAQLPVRFNCSRHNHGPLPLCLRLCLQAPP